MLRIVRSFILLCLALAVTPAYSQLISDFSSGPGNISKWVTFETEGAPLWYVNAQAMTTDMPSYVLNEGGTDFARVLWSKPDHGATWYALSTRPTVVGTTTTAEVRLRGYASDGGVPDINFRLSVWGANAGGTHSWVPVLQENITTDTFVIYTPDLTNERLVSYFTLTVWGGSRNVQYGVDIDYIRINGVEVPQIDPLGGATGTNWGERDLAGWGHGWATVTDGGAPYGNVGSFNIWSGDGAVAVLLNHPIPGPNRPNLTQKPYLHFDWRAAPGTNPSDVAVNFRLYGNATADARFVWGADHTPPATWTHEVIDLTDPSWASFSDVFRIDVALIDVLNDTANPRLIGIEVDNIEFSEFVPVELSTIAID